MFSIVDSVVKKHETCNPFRICKDLNIKVITCPMTGIRGMYKRVKRNTIIFIDSNLSERESEFVCAHELGHHFLHKGDNRVFLDRCTLFVTSPLEKEADLFAACLLTPSPEDVIEDGDTVDGIAIKMGINPEIAKLYIAEYKNSACKNRL